MSRLLRELLGELASKPAATAVLRADNVVVELRLGPVEVPPPAGEVTPSAGGGRAPLMRHGRRD